MLGGWDFAANMNLNGNKVRPDMEVWFQGKLVRASSFLKLTALPDHEADMVRKAAAASYRQQQLAQAEMEDSSSALHSSDAEAASTPGSGSPRVAALSVAVTAAQLAPHTLDIMHGISAAIRPITRLALMAQDTGPAAAAARALDTWLHATGCDGPRQLLKEWGLKVPSKTPMHNVKVSEAWLGGQLQCLRQQQVPGLHNEQLQDSSAGNSSKRVCWALAANGRALAVVPHGCCSRIVL